MKKKYKMSHINISEIINFLKEHKKSLSPSVLSIDNLVNDLQLGYLDSTIFALSSLRKKLMYIQYIQYIVCFLIFLGWFFWVCLLLFFYMFEFYMFPLFFTGIFMGIFMSIASIFFYKNQTYYFFKRIDKYIVFLYSLQEKQIILV